MMPSFLVGKRDLFASECSRPRSRRWVSQRGGYALVFCAASTLMLPGCNSPFFVTPKLFGPGWAPAQRQNAVEFDPYPTDDMGPEIVGGRPRDYAKPLDEVTRARQHNPNAPDWPSAPEQNTSWPSFAPPSGNYSRMPLY